MGCTCGDGFVPPCHSISDSESAVKLICTGLLHGPSSDGATLARMPLPTVLLPDGAAMLNMVGNVALLMAR